MRALLVVVFGCGGAAVVHEPVLPPVFDHSIVLGQRVGPVSLGMTTSQLVAVVPTAKKQDYGGTRVGYVSAELQLHAVVDDDRVVFVAPDDPAYATADGLHIGGSGSQLAKQASKRSHGTESYCVSSTLITVATEASPACAVGTICDVAVGGC